MDLLSVLEPPNAIIAFTKVALPYGWLGNMSAHPVEHQGTVFKTAEHLFQWLRLPEGHPGRVEILAQRSPMSAKMAAKRHRAAFVVDPLSPADLDNMRLVLRLKIAQHPDLRVALIATGDALIIEDCSKRPRGTGVFWGAALTDQGWIGKNALGVLWMELRTELVAKDATAA